MFRSIRDQILVPIVAIQGLAVATMAITAATWAARRVEHQVIDRLNGVVEALGHPNFPYTASVLGRMRALSGAEFIAYGADGQVLETTFTFARPGEALPRLESVPETAHIATLGQAPTVLFNGVRYFASRPSPSAAASSLLVLYPETSWLQARREAAVPPLIFGGGSLVLMATATTWIAQRIRRRIAGVSQQVTRIAGGDFEGFDAGPGRDEIAELTRSINALCHQLREMSRTIQQTERTYVLAQLAAGLAHQIRNALTGARLSIQLHTRRTPSAAGDRSLEIASRQLAISLGRLERRPPVLCDSKRLLGEIGFLVGPKCEHAGVELDVRDAGPLLEVRAEEPALRAALLNLALNAIEAAGSKGTVRLEVIEEDERIILQVSDTGTGPPPGLAGALFEPFTTGKPEGIGLGLALAQQVAQRHHGSLVWERVGHETRFRLALPRTLTVTEEVA